MGDLIGFNVDTREERIVVEHFFKMGDQPSGVRRVAREAAADMVIDPAGRHHIQGLGHHGQRVGIARSPMAAKQERETRGGGKLGRCSKAAMGLVELVFELACRLVQNRFTDRHGRESLPRPLELGRQFFGLFQNFRGACRPIVGNLLQHGAKPGPSPPILRRKVRTGKKRLLLRCQEDGHRPPALPMIHGDRGGHIDLIEIRAFLPVDLDTDEPAIHEIRNGLVLE